MVVVGGGHVAQSQFKYRCLPVAVIPFSQDLGFQPSAGKWRSALSQEIEADSDLMRKVNPENFDEFRTPKPFATNHPSTEGSRR